MKTRWCAVMTLALSSLTAFAGTPDQDPIVKDLRDRFQSGRVPKMNELLGVRWKCKEMSAVKNDFTKRDADTDLTFSRFDDYIVTHVADTSTVLTDNGSELIGNDSIYTLVTTTAFRIDSKGFLVNEYSHAPLYSGAVVRPLAGASSEFRVSSYALCVKL